MAAINFKAKILKFGNQGEKSGWTYIEISEALANKLNPGVKRSYRVKGSLDDFKIDKVAILPMGDGNFIVPFNVAIRKGTGKKVGDTVQVKLELDQRSINPSTDFIKCLKDDSRAYEFFKTLPKGHQNYFSKWIDSAKTSQTKTKRITMAVIALASEQGFSEMMRANRNSRSQ